MSEPMTPREKRAQRIQEYRERNAGSTGRYQRGRTIFLAVLIGLVGLLMAIGSAVNGTGWGVAGGVLVALGAALLLVADRRRVETVSAEDRAAHRGEMLWFLLAVAVVVAGLVVTIHPW